MNYQLSIAIKQRQCSFCKAKITKGTKHFIMSHYPKGDYPVKKNICLNCVSKFLDAEFISYLKALVTQTEHLAQMHKAIETPKAYRCNICSLSGTVRYNAIMEEYICDKCECIFDKEDLETLEEVKNGNDHTRHTS